MASEKATSGIESIETGMPILVALAGLGRPSMLKTIAEAAGMPASKAYRYLVSFQRMGFVDRVADSNHYKLGHQAVHVGLAALASTDPVRLATQIATELRNRFDETTSVSVWGNQGPTIVRIVEGSRPEINARAGTVLPLLSSSSGRMFAAFLPPRIVTPLLQKELKANARRGDVHAIATMSDAQAVIERTRTDHMASIAGEMTPGVQALAAAVLDHRSQPAAVIAVTRERTGLDSKLDAVIAGALRQMAADASDQLGFATGRAP